MSANGKPLLGARPLGGVQVRDRVLLEDGQLGAEQGVDGVEPGGAVLLDAGTDPRWRPFTDGAVGLEGACDGADELAVR